MGVLRAFTLGDFIGITQLASVVIGGEEARLSVVAALDDVLRESGKIESGQARHADVHDRMSAWSGTASRPAAAMRGFSSRSFLKPTLTPVAV